MKDANDDTFTRYHPEAKIPEFLENSILSYVINVNNAVVLTHSV